MANIPLQYPFPYKTNNNTGFTSSVEFNTVTVLGDVTIDQNLTVAGNITTTDLTVGDDLSVGGNVDAQVLRAYGVWDVPTATVTGAGAWIGYNANGQTIFATRKSLVGQTNAFLWYTYDQTNAFVAELMHLNGTRLEVSTRLDIKTNGEMMRLVGTDHTYIRYAIGATDYGYLGFSSSGTQDMTLYNQRSTGHIFIGMANASGRLRSLSPILLQETVTIQCAPGSATYSFILPSSAGTAGQVLTSAGAGNPLYWSAGGGGGGGTVTNVTATSPLGVTSGTTTPNISITSSTGTGAVVLQTDPQLLGSPLMASGSGPLIRFTHDVAGGINYIQSGAAFSGGSAQDLSFGPVLSSTSFMRIKANGNVGIGTTSPGTKFVVEGAPAAFGIQYLASTATLSTTINTVDLIHRWYESTGNASYIDLSWIRTSAGGNWDTAGQRFQAKTDATFQGYIEFNGPTQGGLRFGAGGGVTADAVPERMRITSAGNVGIGITSPAAKLHVQDTSGTGAQIAATRTNTDGQAEVAITSGGSSQFAIGVGGTTWVGGGSALQNKMYWYFGGDFRLAMTTAGNVGIGTNTPTEKLTVAGNITTTDGTITAKSPGPGTPSSVAAASITIDSGTTGVSSPNNTSTIYFNTVGAGGGSITNYIQSLYDANYGYYVRHFSDALVAVSPIYSIDSANPTTVLSRMNSAGGNTGLELRAISGVSYIDMTAKSTSGAADYDFRISKANDNDVNFLNALGGSFIFNSGLRATNFSTNGVHSFTYEQTTFTPVIGFLTGATSNFVAAANGGGISGFSYNIQSAITSRIGKIMTVSVDISFNITLFPAAGPGIYIAVKLPDYCRPSTLGAASGGGWPSTIDPGNLKGYVLLNGTEGSNNIAYVSPVGLSERLLWSIYGTTAQSNQRLFFTMTYNLQ